MSTYYIHTYGCQMNKSDSERIASVLEFKGWAVCDKEEDANLIIVVACSVRQMAIDRVYGKAEKYKKLKLKNPHLKTVLTGCVLDLDKEKLKDRFDMVCGIKEIEENLPLTTLYKGGAQSRDKGSLSSLPFEGSPACAGSGGVGFSTAQPNQINQTIEKEIPPLRSPSYLGLSSVGMTTNNKNPQSYLSITPKYSSNFQASVPIMTGCNNFCAYCVVPHTRGREYSRPVDEILNEVENLVKKGYKEITLLGQNVNSYISETPPLIPPYKGGRATILTKASSKSPLLTKEAKSKSPLLTKEAKSKSPLLTKEAKSKSPLLTKEAKSKSPLLTKEGLGVVNFPTLLRLINSIQGDFWLRFATSHPKDISDDLIYAIAECKKITPYIHLPIQSGSDQILNAMNRKYTKNHYLNLIKKIKSNIPDIMLSTDIIVGFPGETENDFQKTIDVFKKVKYNMAYIARYSPRIGTASYALTDNITQEEKAKRECLLTEILKKTALENNKKLIGKTFKVLIQWETEKSFIGKTAQFINTKIHKNKNLPQNINIGEFIDVKIIKIDCFGMEGEILKKY